MFAKDVAFERMEDGSGAVIVTVLPPNEKPYKITLATCTANEFDVAYKWFYAGLDMRIG